ncbi:Uncharacterised protein [Vibrio cholerae]|uniref:Uncharacterized protein n=1 Tax=Vibrio cholerae TaxID=666 RepID=A0A655Q913_VIBCL|nr:Uncharacterised protein [Vibrio cholerae]CSA69493.1 Uncharacterised protein [Vibrio cholerae]CSC07314.1 Uncharacterised protein [Vibrio cholerae]CSC64097.1 Uncharacterised protein [Vibrio cholerae]CSD13821.1 Uncharacterised protein [Vibrio cholerae]
MRIFIITNRCFHGDGFFGNFQHFADFVFWHLHAFCQFFRQWLTTHLLQHLARNSIQFIDRLDHVYWNTNRTCLVSNRTSDCLTDPPSRIS